MIQSLFYTGLPAYYYDAFFQASDPEELLFYQRHLQNVGLALELGCGTGRLLLELMKMGHAVEGVDCSQQMLTLCKNKAVQQGLQSILYQQNIQALALKKKYGCIFSPLGTFQQIADRHEAYEVLKRCYAHLLPGGKLILYTHLPWYNALPFGEWHQHEPAMLPDGKTIIVHEKAIHDPLEQQLFMTYRYELWQNQELLEHQEKEMMLRWYGRYELEDMLKSISFQNIQVQAGYNDQGPYDVQIFIAQK